MARHLWRAGGPVNAGGPLPAPAASPDAGRGCGPDKKRPGAAWAAPGLPPAALPTPSSTKRLLNSDRRLLGRLGCDCRRLACTDHRHSHGRGHDLPVAAPRLRRLEGASRVKLAIRQAVHLLAAAEVEIGVLGIADRPAAGDLGQGLDRFALVERDLEFLGG